MTEAFDNTSTHLAPHIVLEDSTLVFHSDWHNLNKITINLTGSNVVNKAGEIMLQEVKHGLQSAGVRSLPKYERVTKNKKTSYKVSVLEILPPLTVYNYAGLKFPEDMFTKVFYLTILSMVVKQRWL